MDRNICMLLLVLISLRSLSARRAWIEMGFVDPDADTLTVALRKESVDRNSAGREYDTEG